MLIVVSPYSCADPESRARGGSILACFFFLFVCVCVGEGGGAGYSYIGEKGEKFKIPLQAGHYRPASETPFKWCFADDGPILNADRFSRI